MGNAPQNACVDSDDEDMHVEPQIEDSLQLFGLAALVAVADAQQAAQERAPKRGNLHRDRDYAVKQIAMWPDALFERMFRICREDFVDLRQSLIDAGFRPRNESMAELSSGSSISLETRIFITLRIVAGAAYLDLVWYNVALNHTHEVMFEVLECMNKCSLLDNIKFPQTEAEVANCLAGWREVSMRKFGFDVGPGHLASGDGYVIQVDALNEKDLADAGGLDLQLYWNRKGYWALIVCAFCDAHGRIIFWEMKWPGSTNDIVCYKTTQLYDLYSKVQPGDPLWDTWLALDEAYSSIGGRHHLAPYSKYQLEAAKRLPGWEKPGSLYNQMLAFNNRQSGKRIPIECVFGMYSRRFGIMWKPLPYSVQKCQLVALVCAKLHNLCTNRRITRDLHAAMRAANCADDEGTLVDGLEGLLLGGDDFLAGNAGNMVAEVLPTMKEILAQSENGNLEEMRKMGESLPRQALCPKRDELREHMWNNGLYYDRKSASVVHK